MSTVLVTGAGGFIGSYTAGAFARRGWRVFGTVHRRTVDPADRPPDVSAALGAVTWIQVDLTDAVALRAAVIKASAGRAGGLDAIVHCAGRASDTGRKRLFDAVNVEPVRALAGLARELRAGRLVFVSSTDVYGLRDFHGQDEDALPLLPRPRNPYPVSKVAAEACLRSALPPENFAILRPAQVWGVGDLTLTARIADFLRRSPCIVHFGPWRGTNRWPLAHVRNVAMACVLAATRPEAAGRAINVLDCEITTIDGFTRIVAEVFMPGRRFRTLCLPLWAGAAGGAVISALSNAAGLDRPFADPSHYAVHAVSHNLDFSDRRFRDLLAAAGATAFAREDGIAEIKTHSRPGEDVASGRTAGSGGRGPSPV